MSHAGVKGSTAGSFGMTEQEATDGAAASRRRGSGRERRPTMADVANHVGVSRALVSIVFRGVEGASEATRQRVLEAAAELGYRPDSLAQGLRRNRSRNLGVLFSLRRPFEVELVEHMYPASASWAMTCSSDRSRPAAARTPLSTSCSATAAPD
jgi:hypothetical protein